MAMNNPFPARNLVIRDEMVPGMSFPVKGGHRLDACSLVQVGEVPREVITRVSGAAPISRGEVSSHGAHREESGFKQAPIGELHLEKIHREFGTAPVTHGEFFSGEAC